MTKGYNIRVAGPSDAVAVTALLEASYPVLMSQAYDEAILTPALELMATANPSLLASGTYYLAESRIENLVGCGGWARETPGSSTVQSDVAHLRHFATHPAWTGRGIGRSIYAVCKREAHFAGIKQFECYSSLNAAGFYTALGFDNVGQIEVRIGAFLKLPGVLMRRTI
ncbi:MAG: GNAT family N-acetyltransferase [Gammaproteobacteria bacterium]|jgi:N-acetylglutamate synthase-like GNAT family acetyltransferase